MKKAILMVAVLALVATSANAAVLSMRWVGTSETSLTLNPSDTAKIEVVLTMGALDKKAAPYLAKVSAFDMRLITGGNLPSNTVVTGYSFIAGQVISSPIGQSLETALFSFTDPSDTPFVQGNGTVFSTVLATITIHCAGPTGPEGVGIMFNGVDPLPMLFNGATGWTKTYPLDPTASTQFTMGQGAPGAVDSYGAVIAPARPLTLIQTPEPASLALLGLAALAIVRRK